MELFLVRHAKSFGSNGFGSVSRSGLTDDGIEQARRVGAALKTFQFDEIYCSKLKRARDTLALMGLNSSRINYSSQLNEHRLGVYKQNGLENWSAFWSDACSSGRPIEQFTPPQGESFIAIHRRVTLPTLGGRTES